MKKLDFLAAIFFFLPPSREMLQRYLFLFLLAILLQGQNRYLVLQQGFGVQEGI